jgi:hypothetical protein
MELAGQVCAIDGPLRAGLEILQLDLLRGGGLTEDHREVGSLARGGLDLPAELALAQVSTGRKTRAS